MTLRVEVTTVVDKALFSNDRFPDKKYNIIYADPPWTYRDKALAGQRGAGCKYNLMTQEELCSLPIQSIASDDCCLFLWVTFPMLREGLNTIKAWGFDYRTVAFNWVKKNKISDSPFWGMGNWTRSNSELCLLGLKGKPKRQSASVHSIIGTEVIYSSLEEHSKKPGIVRDKIVDLCGDLPRIELFARQMAEGWDAWGDEAEVANGIHA
jgi:N6-adenosine-specific RNA methylase IME4